MRPMPMAAIGTALALFAGAALAQGTGGTAIFVLGSDPSGLNRNLSTSTPDGLVACKVYEGLVDVTPEGDIVPRLAESWEISEDGTTYTFHLRDARFHDGTPFTSADVKYTYEEISGKFSSVFSGAAKAIESIDTPAPDEVVLHLSKPYGPLLRTLNCTQGAAILPKHLYEGTDPATNPVTTSEPVGTGPFMFDEWRRGQYVKLAKNPDYWEEGLPYLDAVIGQVLPQASSRTQALMAGEVDYVNFTLLPSNDYMMLEGNPGFTMIPSPVPAIDVMLANTRNPDLADPKVRQAMMMAIDRSQLLATAFNGIGAAATMPFTNRMGWAADADTDFDALYPYDPEKANALLDEAGKARGADGTRFSLSVKYFSTESDSQLEATALKAMLREVGIELVLEPGERVSVIPAVFTNFDYDLALVAYNSGGDPAIGLTRIWSSATEGRNFGNPTGYSSPEVDALFEEGQTATDRATRGRAYAEAQRILGRDLPVLTLHERIAQSGVSAKLQGLEEEYYLPSFRAARFAE
ncbi:ABC transporter substrate-binding protein [Poseidonocella sp. HB161398]|uniref:ABC transporter substrate-binding protein n=1 Tax=Poseidonocella sp. HB161398 TaxID=2320855 RepID=UPI001486B8A8|nr:ABC transporter substrate-binding protein [Poseidonocella sp. HB161398]